MADHHHIITLGICWLGDVGMAQQQSSNSAGVRQKTGNSCKRLTGVTYLMCPPFWLSAGCLRFLHIMSAKVWDDQDIFSHVQCLDGRAGTARAGQASLPVSVASLHGEHGLPQRLAWQAQGGWTFNTAAGFLQKERSRKKEVVAASVRALIKSHSCHSTMIKTVSGSTQV